jgi:hypothetical protein
MLCRPSQWPFSREGVVSFVAGVSDSCLLRKLSAFQVTHDVVREKDRASAPIERYRILIPHPLPIRIDPREIGSG